MDNISALCQSPPLQSQTVLTEATEPIPRDRFTASPNSPEFEKMKALRHQSNLRKGAVDCSGRWTGAGIGYVADGWARMMAGTPRPQT